MKPYGNNHVFHGEGNFPSTKRLADGPVKRFCGTRTIKERFDMAAHWTNDMDIVFQCTLSFMSRHDERFMSLVDAVDRTITFLDVELTSTERASVIETVTSARRRIRDDAEKTGV